MKTKDTRSNRFKQLLKSKLDQFAIFKKPKSEKKKFRTPANYLQILKNQNKCKITFITNSFMNENKKNIKNNLLGKIHKNKIDKKNSLKINLKQKHGFKIQEKWLFKKNIYKQIRQKSNCKLEIHKRKSESIKLMNIYGSYYLHVKYFFINY